MRTIFDWTFFEVEITLRRAAFSAVCLSAVRYSRIKNVTITIVFAITLAVNAVP